MGRILNEEDPPHNEKALSPTARVGRVPGRRTYRNDQTGMLADSLRGASQMAKGEDLDDDSVPEDVQTRKAEKFLKAKYWLIPRSWTTGIAIGIAGIVAVSGVGIMGMIKDAINKTLADEASKKAKDHILEMEADAANVLKEFKSTLAARAAKVQEIEAAEVARTQESGNAAESQLAALKALRERLKEFRFAAYQAGSLDFNQVNFKKQGWKEHSALNIGDTSSHVTYSHAFLFDRVSFAEYPMTQVVPSWKGDEFVHVEVEIGDQSLSGGVIYLTMSVPYTMGIIDRDFSVLWTAVGDVAPLSSGPDKSPKPYPEPH
jgi:hypothetical protein